MKTKTPKKPAPAPPLKITVRSPLVNNPKLEKQIVEDTMVVFSKERAFQILELKTFKGEREVNERHVQHLYDAYRSGRFMWEHVVIGLCKMGGELYRLNGQHTCWMRANINDDISPKIRCITYRVDDEEELRSLYCTFDQGKTRTSAHTGRVLLVGSVSDQVWPSAMGTLSSGLKFYLFEEQNELRRVGPDEMHTLITTKYPQLYERVALFVQKQWDVDKTVRRVAVTAAMFCTFESSPNKSEEFWDPVFTGLGLSEKTDPRYQLRRYLHDHGHGSGAKSVVSQEDVFRVSVSAWNKWRSGDRVVQGLRPTEKRLKPK